MGLPKGQTNNPKGRTPGVQNKITSNMKELFSTFLNGYYDSFIEDYKTLESFQRAKIYLEVAKFIIPTPKEIEIKNGSEEEKTVIVLPPKLPAK